MTNLSASFSRKIERKNIQNVDISFEAKSILDNKVNYNNQVQGIDFITIRRVDPEIYVRSLNEVSDLIGFKTKIIKSDKIPSNLIKDENLIEILKKDDVVKLCEININDDNIKYIVYTACLLGSNICFKYLYKNFSFNITDEIKNYAVVGGSVDIMELCDVDKYSYEYILNTFERYSSGIHSEEFVVVNDVLEELDDEVLVTLLHECVEEGYVEAVFLLLRVKPEIVDVKRRTFAALHRASSNDKLNNLEMVEILLQNGANVNITDGICYFFMRVIRLYTLLLLIII